MNEAVENLWVSKNDDGTLRGRCAQAHLPCEDRGGANVTPGAPVPECIPGDFTVVIGDVMPGWVMEGLEAEFGKYAGGRRGREVLEGLAEAVSGFLSAMHWVEVEVQGVVLARCLRADVASPLTWNIATLPSAFVWL